MKLTLKNNKRIFTFEDNSADMDINDLVNAFKSSLYAHGFQPETIQEYVFSEEYYLNELENEKIEQSAKRFIDELEDEGED